MTGTGKEPTTRDAAAKAEALAVMLRGACEALDDAATAARAGAGG